jgi:hypothetical protein
LTVEPICAYFVRQELWASTSDIQIDIAECLETERPFLPGAKMRPRRVS